MKSIFKKIAFVLALAMVVSAFPAQTAAAAGKPYVKATKTLYIGSDANEQYSDSAWVPARNKTGYTMTFKVADPEIVTVSKRGYLTAVSAGKTVVTVTFSKAGAKDIVDTCTVIVKKNAVAASIDADSAKAISELKVGDEVNVKAVLVDADGSTKGVTDKARFYSKNKNVFTVDYKTGKLTAVAAGTAKLYVYGVQWDWNTETGKWATTTTTKWTGYDVTVKADEFTAKATGVKEITVFGNFAKDAKFAIKKGNVNVSATATVADDGKSAKLALATKLTEGTYTVSCGDLVAELVAEDEKVADIIVRENGAMVTTSTNRLKVYVHYDVLNQYGESVRKAYEIQWTCSAGTVTSDDKTNGVLTITSATQVTYGTPIVLTGVHTAPRNVKSVTASMTAGLENCVGSVKVLGVTKIGSNEILKELPASFEDGEYALVYEMIDRLGNVMKYDDAMKADLTFTSTSPLLIQAFTDADKIINGETINGEIYGAVVLHPGLQVRQGGIANIQVISVKTGTPVEYSLRVASEQILDSFRIIVPDSIITENDGTRYDFGFEAFDTTGAPVKDFRVLYKSVTFSDPNYWLVENNDGSASIRYLAHTVGAVKGIDIPQVCTVTTTNGKSSITQLNIKASSTVATVRGYEGVTNILEGNSIDVFYKNRWWGHDGYLTYYDQYDRSLDSASGVADSVEYIAVKHTGKLSFSTAADTTGMVNADSAYEYFAKGMITIAADSNCTEGILAQTVEFALADSTGKILSGSEKKVVFNIVDVKQCTSFSIAVDGSSDKAKNYDDNKKFKVTGNLANGSTVAIPNRAPYIIYEASVPYNVTGTLASINNNVITATGSAITGSAITIAARFDDPVHGGSDQFADKSVNKPEGGHPNRMLSYNVKASIYTEDGELKDIVYTTVSVGIDGRWNNRFTMAASWAKPWIKYDAADAQAYVNANSGVIEYKDLLGYLSQAVDQYDKGSDVMSGTNYLGVTITITKVIEGTKGLTSHNLVVAKNAINYNDVMISGAEIGDTFLVTYSYQGASLQIKMTVGSDNTASFSSATDTLRWY